jgi:hypothetical protein
VKYRREIRALRQAVGKHRQEPSLAFIECDGEGVPLRLHFTDGATEVVPPGTRLADLRGREAPGRPAKVYLGFDVNAV